MDNFEPQSGDLQLRVGHEEDHFRIHGIVLFMIILVVSGILTFIAAGVLMRLFEWAERTYIDKPPSAVQQQLSEQRGEPATREGVRPQPDWYNREVDQKMLEKTFTTPRLQEDDAEDMKFFLNAEQQRLDSTGKDPDGNIHIPIDRAIDVLSGPQRGLPSVNGTFTPQPPLGSLEAVADAAKRRVGEAATPAKPATNRKQ